MASLTKTITFYKDGSNRKEWIKLIATCSSYPLSATSHRVTVALSYKCNYSPSKTASRTAEVVIEGVGKTFKFTGYTKATTAKAIGSFSQDVYCSSTGTIPIEAYLGLPSNVEGGGLTGQDWNYTPDRVTGIYSASNVTTNALVIDNAVTLTLKNRSTNSHYDIDLVFPDNSKVPLLVNTSDTGASTYTTNKLPSTILNSISNGTSISATLQVKTYDVQYKLGYLGVSTKAVTVNMPDSYKPQIEKVEMEYFNGNKPTDRLISGYSTAKFRIYPLKTDVYNNKSFKYDKPKYVNIFIDGESTPRAIAYDSTMVDNTYFTVSLKMLTRFTVNRDIDVEIVYTDKRNNTASVKKTVYIYQYNNPSIVDCEAIRCNSDGAINKNGTNINIKLNTVYSECGGEQDGIYGNSLTYKIGYSTDGGGTYTFFDEINSHDMNFTKIYSDFSSENTYTFKAIIVDDFNNSAELEFEVGSQDVLLDIYKKTVSFGAAASRTNEEVYPDGAFEVVLPTYLEHVSELIMLAPNGTRYKLTVDNSGSLSTVEVI